MLPQPVNGLWQHPHWRRVGRIGIGPIKTFGPLAGH